MMMFLHCKKEWFYIEEDNSSRNSRCFVRDRNTYGMGRRTGRSYSSDFY